MTGKELMHMKILFRLLALGLLIGLLSVSCAPAPSTVTATLPPDTVTLPPGTTTLPPDTTTLPPSTATLPPSTTTQPPVTVTLPPTTVTMPTTISPADVAGAYTINVAFKQGLGLYLTDGAGMTLYWTTLDAQDQSNVSSDLLATWPIFYAPIIAAPSSLIGSAFSTLIERADGFYQTMYEDWPLYYYAGDTKPGDTNGQGLDGQWFVVNPNALGPGLTTAATTQKTT